MRPYDGESISYSNQGKNIDPDNLIKDSLKKLLHDQSRQQSGFRQFIREFIPDDENDYTYRNQLQENYDQGNYFLEVNWKDLNSFSSELGSLIRDNPMKVLPMFELAAQDAIIMTRHPRPERDQIQKIQIQLINLDINKIPIRNLESQHISKLVKIPGIIISATKNSPKATKLRLMCTNCQTITSAASGNGFASIMIPRACPNQSNEQNTKPCPLDPFTILTNKSTFIDIQRLKLQELPEDISSGEMPKQIWLFCSRNLVNKVSPGSRVIITGIFKLFENNDKRENADASVRKPYIEVVGIQETNFQEKHGNFTNEEEEEILTLSKENNLYERIWRSVAPAIFESEDIKKSISCLLFSGSRKHLQNGMKLRGDINVLLLGDPSVAKSQFLKWVHEVAPICVYTSGKGSSASGLTASVLREPGTGEFHLEGGAMVLADGGIVCIDEFDKMRENDRVAIHEAMEQQTISIAKAGITTMLNSRTSVLAAANPIFGRYDDLRSTQDNIDFETTILSRFDLIFIIRDIKNRDKDERLAQHIMNLHIKRGTNDKRFTNNNTNLQIDNNNNYNDEDITNDNDEDMIKPISSDKLTKYIKYCRLNCHPRLSRDAKSKLKSYYVQFRQNYREKELLTDEQNAIPLTVRQLESLIRISESLAKMQLREEVTVQHVEEAVRLFKVSTLKSANQSDNINTSSSNTRSFGQSRNGMENIQKCERNIKRFVPIGSSKNVSQIKSFMNRKGSNEQDTLKALDILHKRGEIQYFAGRRKVRRIA